MSNSITWRAIYESIQGTSHRSTGVPCQDAFRFDLVDMPDGPTLIACVADGAGSAERSEDGSRQACDSIVRTIRSALENGFRIGDCCRNDALGWFVSAREEVRLLAEQASLPIREYATTLLTAVVGTDRSVFAQIGDGAIVVRAEGDYEAVFWPQGGEFAGTTNFLTSPDFGSFMDFTTRTGAVNELALFTDGLERLILRFADRAVHGPFLAPIAEALRRSDDTELLCRGLRDFLDSDSVNQRTDDDKTLLFACRSAGGA